MIRTCDVVAVCGGSLLLFALTASAATMPAIKGHVFTASRQQPVPSAEVQLYIDDGDQRFNVSDLMAASTTTDASGRYEFSELDADTSYFVIAADQVSEIQHPGAVQYVIDSFDITQSVISNPITGARMGSVSGPGELVLGGHRDMYMEVLGGIADAKLRANPFSINSNLQIDFAAGVTGMAAVTWDGIGGLTGMEPDAGLGGMDLTHGGRYEGIVLRLAIDAAGEGQKLQLLLHSDSGMSSAELEFPVVPMVIPTAMAYVPFTDFIGNADATSINALQLVVNASVPSVDAKISMIGITGPNTVDFAVPEPSAALVFVTGCWALLSVRRRRHLGELRDVLV